MRVRDWRSPVEGSDLGPCPGRVLGGNRNGVTATAGIPPKVPTGLGHTHGEWEKHRERERAKRAAAKAVTA